MAATCGSFKLQTVFSSFQGKEFSSHFLYIYYKRLRDVIVLYLLREIHCDSFHVCFIFQTFLQGLMEKMDPFQCQD